MCDRVIALIDMDCFYCQVETKLNPQLKGKPLAVIQYNQWQGGGIIAVNYEARAFGVTRHLRGNEAKKKCPDIILVPVPSVREKADLTKYRDAGNEVTAVFCQFTDCVEKASVDEAYLDLTNLVDERIQLVRQEKIKPTDLHDTFVAGFSPPDSCDEEERANGLRQWLKNIYCEHLPDSASERLAVGAIIVQEMRASVYKQTGFHCSAGIAHNKILAKLACGLHKPNRQTVLPQSSVSSLYSNLSIKKIRSLGGKFGDYITEVLGCETMSDLTKYTEAELQKYFDEKHGTWLYNIARGIDLEPVNRRLITKSIGCCKKFPGKKALSSKKEVQHWLFELSSEVIERLKKDYEQNKRRAKSITVSFKQANNPNSGSSRCGSLSSYDVNSMANDAYELLKKSNSSLTNDDKWNPPLTFLGISAGKFNNDCTASSKPISTFFKVNMKNETSGNPTHFNYGAPDEKDLPSSNSSRILTANSTKHKADETKPFLRKYFDLKHSGSKLEQNNMHSVEGTDAHSSNNVVSTIISSKLGPDDSTNAHSNSNAVSTMISTNLEPNDNTDAKSFFKRYYDMKNGGHKTGKLEQSCAQSDEEATAKCNMNSEVECSEIAVPKICTDATSISLDQTSGNMVTESWISPQEIFPDLDQLDSDVVCLLPSPMQRKLKLCIENKQVITEQCNFVSENRIKLKKNFESNEENEECLGFEPFMSHETDSSHKAKRSKLNNEDAEFVTSDRKKTSVSNNEHVYVNVNIEHNEKMSSNSIHKNHFKNINDIVIDKVDCCDDIDKISKDVKPSFEFDENDSEVQLCPQCNKTILLINYLDHLDFHVAEDLHKQLNNVSSQPTVSKDRSLPKVNDKKKNGIQSIKKPKNKKKDTKLRSITNFFTPI